tara:strand:+ start:1813 stop:2235 length:423 start_codon:yes stop_codon:yes gene_type:complete
MKKATQETLAKLAKRIDWKSRTKSNESWRKWLDAVNEFMGMCDKWQLHYLIPEKTMGKHKIECGEIVGKVPIEEQIKSIKSSPRSQTRWIQYQNVEYNCARHLADNENPYINELRKKITNLAENRDYAKYFIYTLEQEVI